MAMRITIAMVLAVAGLVGAPGCRRDDGHWERCLRDRPAAAPREEAPRSVVVFRREGGRWVPRSIARLRGWKDRARHLDAPGRVELADAPDGPALAEGPATGPELLEAVLFQNVTGPDTRPEVSRAREKALEGAEALLELPSGAGRYARYRAAAALPGAVARALGAPPEEWLIDLAALPEKVREGEEPATHASAEGITAGHPVETVHWSGHPRDRINLLVLPDGFTADEMPLFRQKAAEMAEALLQEHSPYAEYRDLINIVRLDAPSEESGADCDDQKYSPRRNRYGSSFPVACINALVGTKFNDRFIYQLNPLQVARDAHSVRYEGVPLADEAFVLVNSPKYGGAAVIWANQTLASGWATAAHEMGHSWGRLADEYTVEGDLCMLFMASSRNLSFKKTRASRVKWGSWIEDGTPLPTPDEGSFDGVVGLFQGGAGGCRKVVYRPMRTCKMRSSHQDFCPPCKEQMILRIYDRASPISGPLRRDGEGVTADVARGDRMRAVWLVDGAVAQDTAEYRPLGSLHAGTVKKRVQLVLIDDRAPVRRDRCDLVFAVDAWF